MNESLQKNLELMEIPKASIGQSSSAFNSEFMRNFKKKTKNIEN